MKNYLANPDAAFYHITRRARWENSIRQNGLRGDGNGRIFVSRSPDLGILASIAINQLLNFGEEPDLVILELSQAVNNFLVDEIEFDYQSNELTFPFQNIINRSVIPIGNFVYHDEIRMSLDELDVVSIRSDMKLSGSEYFEKALLVTYEEPADKRRYRFIKDSDSIPLFSKVYC